MQQSGAQSSSRRLTADRTASRAFARQSFVLQDPGKQMRPMLEPASRIGRRFTHGLAAARLTLSLQKPRVLFVRVHTTRYSSCSLVTIPLTIASLILETTSLCSRCSPRRRCSMDTTQCSSKARSSVITRRAHPLRANAASGIAVTASWSRSTMSRLTTARPTMPQGQFALIHQQKEIHL
jgi:hypothetical protein